jgi:hypothetical protein
LLKLMRVSRRKAAASVRAVHPVSRKRGGAKQKAEDSSRQPASKRASAC